MPSLYSDSMDPSEGDVDALADTGALEAEPDSAELAALAPFAEQLDPRPPPRLPPGTVLAESFEIEEVLGAGGMGIVYRARDLQLGRPVALKLHRPMAKGTERLMREAASMAKLTHPNVATVHEVGTHEGMLFIAMELVDGVTARRWVTEGERTPMQVVALYHAAGEGLAAAHRAGLVHRDFKPENVLVDPDDVPRVVDFGLARPVTEVPIETVPGPSRLPTDPGILTATGAAVGTPAYMAPEQFDGGEVDARADQFSFCVSLHEALYGRRPFAGISVVQLLAAMAQGAIRSPPKGTRVPKKLRRIVVRGLSARPDERWPSMEALLEQLHRLLVPRARRWVLPSLAVGVLGVGGGLVLGQAVEQESCTGARARLTGIWDDERREEVKAAIVGTELSYAPDTWERVEQGLDEYADGWASKHTQVCEATSVRQEQSAEVLDLRMGCMDERLVALRAAVKVLADADATVVENAVKLVAGLPKFSRCDDVEALRARVPPPEDPEVAEEVEALHQRVVGLQAEVNAGRFRLVLDEADRVVERAEALSYGPLVAEAKQARGFTRNLILQYAEAERDLLEAFELAMEHRHDWVATNTARWLTYVVGQQARHAEALVWGRAALAHAKRSGDDVAIARALSESGTLYEARGEYERAKRYHERALRLWETAQGANPLEVARSLSDVGIVLRKQGEYEEAQRLFERAMRIEEKAVGPGHTAVAGSLINLGTVLYDQGEYEQSRLHFERALRVFEQALGANHLRVATTLNNIGAVLTAQGEYEEAQRLHERALPIREKGLGVDHPTVADSLLNIGTQLFFQGEYEQAKPYLERALRITEKALGADHPNVARCLNNLGLVLGARGEYEQAQHLYERVLRINEKALGADHPTLATSHNNLGNMLKGQGETEQALLHYERSLQINEEALGPDHPKVAGGLQNIANLHEERGEYEQAQHLYERALRTRQKVLGADHPDVVKSLVGLALATVGVEDFDAARAHAERAVSILERADDAAPTLLAMARFALARALWPDRVERPRARELAEQARDAFAEHGTSAEDDLARVEQWLTEHRVP